MKEKVYAIIPTLNEQHYLPFLLEDLTKSDYPDLEIIVGDNGSTDDTKDVLKEFSEKYDNIKWTEVIFQNPSTARNEAVNSIKNADKESYLIFLDADARVPSDFISDAVGEMNKKNYALGVHFWKPMTNAIIPRIFFSLNNLAGYLMQKNKLETPGGGNIVVKKWLHDKIGGFNEAMKQTNDRDYGHRASNEISPKQRGYLHHQKSLVDMRRFDNDTRSFIRIQLSMTLDYIFNAVLKKSRAPSYSYGKHQGRQEVPPKTEELKKIYKL